MLNHEMVISAKVSVDAQGRVKRVVPLNSLSRIERSIWQSYASVITTWEFDSAVQNGKPVPGETILRFRVQPAR
ncbi:MAG TPA: hypothetical protein VES20_02905 [Bryobacteraceae bacterium]|nr:hypothetical protein [Bryobacteraceae bacterium]